ALSLNSLSASKWALISLRARLIAFWFEVYLKTKSNTTPDAIPATVTVIQPGNRLIGANNHRPSTFPAVLAQTAIHARTSVIRYIPDRAAGRRPAPLLPQS